MMQGAIFDVDGTLLDSMYIWDTVGERYLRRQGCEPDEELRRMVKTMSLYQAACYFREHYGLPLSVEEIMDGINGIVEDFYRKEAQLKPGTEAFLQKLHEKQVRMCIATATDRYLVEEALERCGVLGYFTDIFTCTSVGHSKNEPHIFREALRHLGTEKEQTYVFEDAFHAASTAAQDGFPVAALYDASEDQQQELLHIAAVNLHDFGDFDRFWQQVGR